MPRKPRTPEQNKQHASGESERRARSGGWKTRQRDLELQKRYGITLRDYEDLVDRQRGVCAICDNFNKRQLVVDHCHTTQRNRGLLCDNCNLGLGKFQDNPRLLRIAAAYLEQ